MMVLHSIVEAFIEADTMDEKTFDEMMDELDANIARIKSEIAREYAAFENE